MSITEDAFYWPSKLTNQEGLDVAQYEANWRTLISYLNGHKSNHAIGGGDVLTPTDIGAAPANHNHGTEGIIGLDTALSGVAVANSIPSQADFEARAAALRAATAGSGFVKWGGFHPSSGWHIAEGLWLSLWGGPVNVLAIGGISRSDIETGVSVFSCNGTLITIDQGYPRASAYAAPAYVPLAPTPSSLAMPARHDLYFLEVWHERVDAKDVVYPLGNVQYVYPGVSLADGSVLPLATNLVDPAYSSYGMWQNAPSPGYCARWSTMTNAQKKAFAADSANNLYQEADGSVIQVRWRFRIIPGAGTSWFNVSNTKTDWLAYDGSGEYRHVVPRGQIVSQVADLGTSANNSAYRQQEFGKVHDNPYAYALGSWVAMTGYDKDPAPGYRGQCYAVPFILMKRERNTGIYHATFNPDGCGVATGASPTSLSECFALPKTGGTIASAATGHPQGLFADQIVPNDVVDLRMNVCRADAHGILRKGCLYYRTGFLRRKKWTIAASFVDRNLKASGPVVSSQGLEIEPLAYNRGTGELVYSTSYVGAGAVTAYTLVEKNGQAVMQLATDPSVDGIVDIDLADNVGLELPYFFPQEG